MRSPLSRRVSRWVGGTILLISLVLLKLGASKIITGEIRPSANDAIMGIIISFCFSALYLWRYPDFWTFLPERPDTFSNRLLKPFFGLWLSGSILLFILIANLDVMLSRGEQGHCFRELIRGESSANERYGGPNYKFYFYDFDGKSGESEIGVPKTFFEQYHQHGQIFDLYLWRSHFGTIALDSIRPAQTPQSLTTSCW